MGYLRSGIRDLRAISGPVWRVDSEVNLRVISGQFWSYSGPYLRNLMNRVQNTLHLAVGRALKAEYD